MITLKKQNDLDKEKFCEQICKANMCEFCLSIGRPYCKKVNFQEVEQDHTLLTLKKAIAQKLILERALEKGGK